MEFTRENWPYILLAIAIAAAVFFLLRPRQRVELNGSDQPLRPHMQKTQQRSALDQDGHGNGIAREAAAATSDVAGQIIDAPVHENLPGASGPPDDLQRLKGVGPKFASSLNLLGITRFEQLAKLGEGEIDRLDNQLGPFKGRLQRDQIPLQAEYLARGDQDGFEQRFGKL